MPKMSECIFSGISLTWDNDSTPYLSQMFVQEGMDGPDMEP